MQRFLNLCKKQKAQNSDDDKNAEMPRPGERRDPTGSGEDGDATQSPARMLPPPIVSYQPEPRYTMDTIVTPSTIIPTCYFQILDIEWNEHEQVHEYDIRSLPQLGEQRQPDIRRKVIEDDLTSFEEMGLRFHAPPNIDELAKVGNSSNRTTYNVAPYIEVGDEVSIRMNSTGPVGNCEWIPGKVVGMHAQYGLWSCFIVSYNNGSRTMPCTETLLKLTKKGTQIGRKRFDLMETIRDENSSRRRVRTLRPLMTRKVPEWVPPEFPIPPSGICFGDAGKLA